MLKKIVVYSTPFCAPCENLKKFLRDKNIIFDSVDLMMNEEAAEFLEEKGIRASPVLEVDGKYYFGNNLEHSNLISVLEL